MSKKLTKEELIFMVGRSLALDYESLDEFQHDVRMPRKARKWLSVVEEVCDSKILKQYKKELC